MDPDVFRGYAREVKKHADYVYLHVLGEPLLHPKLDQIMDVAAEEGLRVCLTTNGTLFHKKIDILNDIRVTALDLESCRVTVTDCRGGSSEMKIKQTAEHIVVYVG